MVFITALPYHLNKLQDFHNLSMILFKHSLNGETNSGGLLGEAEILSLPLASQQGWSKPFKCTGSWYCMMLDVCQLRIR